MIKNAAASWIIAIATLSWIAVLIAVVIVLWPPTLVTGLLLSALALLPAIAALASLSKRRNQTLPLLGLGAKDIIEMSDEELSAFRLEAMADFERRLEIRELRLARQIRAARISDEDYLDLLEAEPSDEELEALVGKDRALIALIEDESRIVFERIRANRYAAEKGVDSDLIVADVRQFVEKVARLYRPDADDVLLETEIELIAKSFSSVSLHLLMVVDDLPLNLKSYNTAKIYRLIRRGVSYYGTYKAFRPYLEHGLNALQLGRLAVGMNPVAVGAAWLAGKLTTQGAKVVGERLLQQKALQLLNDFIRVIGFEAAMMYGGGFRHRDANWVFGAELVNLEILRGEDFSGRDSAMAKLCNLVLRNEFDRIQLLTRLSHHKPIDVEKARPLIIMTAQEREKIVTELAKHCRETGVNMNDHSILEWRHELESTLDIAANSAYEKPKRSAIRTATQWLDRRRQRQNKR